MRDAFVSALTELAARDERIMIITGDLGFGVLTEFAQRFPRQFLNAGVAEQNMTGVATGLALEGRTVFTYSIGNFPTLRCLEQVRNDACYHQANVKVVCVGGGFSYGALGISHHATEDLSIMRSLPGMTVVAPGDRWETGEATKAVAALEGTCYLRLDKSFAPPTRAAEERFVLGRARVVREGGALTIIAAGGILGEVLKAADSLFAEGLPVRVVSMHTIKPLDKTAVLEACRETGGMMTVEEHTTAGGLGSAVAEVCMDEDCHPRRFVRLGLQQGFSSIVGSQAYLRSRYGLDAAAIAAAAVKLLGSTPRKQVGL